MRGIRLTMGWLGAALIAAGCGSGDVTGTPAASSGGAGATPATGSGGVPDGVGGVGIGGVGGMGAVAASGGLNATGGASGGEPGAVACPTPTTPLITDFTFAGDAEGVAFGDSATTFSGATHYYPDSLVSDVTGNAWHLTGTVSDFAGFGISLANACSKVDASAYSGIQFSISGSLPAGRTLTFWMETAANAIPSAWYADHGLTAPTPNFGRCRPPSNNPYDGSCSNPEFIVAIPPSPTVVQIPWAALSGGSPDSSVTPSEIGAFGWYLSWGGTTDTPYAIDILIDDLAFMQ